MKLPAVKFKYYFCLFVQSSIHMCSVVSTHLLPVPTNSSLALFPAYFRPATHFMSSLYYLLTVSSAVYIGMSWGLPKRV